MLVTLRVSFFENTGPLEYPKRSAVRDFTRFYIFFLKMFGLTGDFPDLEIPLILFSYVE